ncbi:MULTISPECIES: Lrp/AsnC family transcriptional regulator [unclassified Pseudodesulfovibrio]|uniref:siroheme decarboxylase subunit beta n=1 Tax=unclassified Pseudodesulfovibrio TaxID=2661612 RepID=UPI000FEBBD56|nr:MULTISPECIES: Lrp/AsnC family transcriptional regulator [unclassified Pseudodesulfovibrio]MCJ2166165.1 Lrp/AsnC family transcriptional regulator [Pseudodesulfovibrio sp. S3-i]RWU02397.1 Lrp/AsnC family transcriptional regulator [Pseudodesulfovibrio sp. S3]
MAMQFTQIEERILALAGTDLPDTEQPFKSIAEAVGATEQQVIDLLADLKERKIIRRFGATLRHQKAGYSHNAMVAWRVPEERAEEVGGIFAARPEISHCYIRRTYPEWTYNFYTMIHGERPGHTDEVVAELEKVIGIDDNCVLRSLKELKKTSMVYFK